VPAAERNGPLPINDKLDENSQSEKYIWNKLKVKKL
jgi:hypothetical protein